MNRLLHWTLILLLMVWLGGCATSRHCASGASTAREAAAQRLPLDAWILELPERCRSEAAGVWAGVLERDCDPLFGFHAGTRGAALPSQCQVDAVTSAWNIGNEIASMTREYDDVRLQLSNSRITPTQRRDLRARRVVIERDLPQLRALARAEGFLAAASPDSDWLKLGTF